MMKRSMQDGFSGFLKQVGSGGFVIHVPQLSGIGIRSLVTSLNVPY